MSLHLLPNLLADALDHRLFLPYSVDAAVLTLDGLIAESVTGGRRFLKRFQTKRPPYEIPIALISESADFLLEPLKQGENWGVVSDAGLPCIADPGSELVRLARQRGIAIHTYSGPSSITMALVLSGLPAQRFSFHGYLAKEPQKRKQQIAKMQQVSTLEKSTQLFIEAPFRNCHTFDSCLQVLNPTTWLTVATDLTLPTQWVMTQTVVDWKKQLLSLDKKPTIFLLYCAYL